MKERYFDQADRPGQQLTLLGKKSPTGQTADALLSNELNWGRSHFIAELLFHAELSPYYAIDEAALHQMARDFTAETHITVDVSALIAEHWLRQVYQCIFIPEMISQARQYAADMEALLDTFRFLRACSHAPGDSPLRQDELRAKGIEYEKNHSVSLALDEAFRHNYWSEKDGLVDFSPMSAYQLIYDRLDSFRFIQYILDRYHSTGSGSGLLIPQATFTTALDRHRLVFPQAPELAHWISSKTVEPHSNS